MKIKYLINPFERIAGWQALVIGVIIIALTALFGSMNSIFFTGTMQVGPIKHNFVQAIVSQTLNWFIPFLILWLAGVCFSKTKIRVIDVAGTTSLACAPLLLMVIIYFLPIAPASLYDIPRVIIMTLIYIPTAIWVIALMYNAFSVSCHMKGSRGIITFIGAFIIAEVLLLIIYYFLMSYLFFNSPVSNNTPEINMNESAVIVTDSLTIRKKTEKVIHAFERGDFDAITVYFDATMKKGLPASGLKMVWLQLTMVFGAFQKADFNNIKEFPHKDNMTVVIVPLSFEKEALNLQITFNKDGTIAGLYIKPAK